VEQIGARKAMRMQVSGLARNGKTLSARNRPRNLSAQTHMGRAERNAVCVLSAGGHVGMRILLLVDWLVQELYRPAAILLGNRKMKTLPALYRLQKERD
jgi:hypothetical protein